MKEEIIVCILTYNNEFHIRKTLDSISNLEIKIACIDSGSNDNTVSIVKEYSEWIFINPMKLWDAGKQRNFAYKNLKLLANWILFLDSDEELNSQLFDELKLVIRENKFEYAAIRSIYHLNDNPLNSISNNTHHDRFVKTTHDDDLFSSSPGEVFIIRDRKLIKKLKNGYVHHVDAKGFKDWFKRILNYSYENGRIDCDILKSNKIRHTRNLSAVRRYRIVFFFFLPLLYLTYYFFVRKSYRDGLYGIIFSFVMSFAYLTYPFGFIKQLFSKHEFK